MSDDDLYVEPDNVRNTGQQLSDIAAEALTKTNQYFDSQADAAKDNPGFTTGAKLVEFANKLHGEMNGFITDLDTNAQQVVQAAQAYQTTDDDNAGLLRELSALNGQTKPALPGQ
ncbi:type VII secretion target [Nocardia sp. NBC_01388]|uniref:type VII secretion target n=1 Tax=Nocardia sp. NBC_01388 TaxID=2903596 RepID=UPI00324C8766